MIAAISAHPGDMVPVGRITGAMGIKGWIKLRSDTQPFEHILSYSPWYLQTDDGWVAREVCEGRLQPKGLVVRLQGCEDRDAALELRGTLIAVRRDQLEPLDEGQYYWADLMGLRVLNLQGVLLGKVLDLLETGSNDVLVVDGDRERLIPFIRQQVIQKVDLAAGQIWVDWDADF